MDLQLCPTIVYVLPNLHKSIYTVCVDCGTGGLYHEISNAHADSLETPWAYFSRFYACRLYVFTCTLIRSTLKMIGVRWTKPAHSPIFYTETSPPWQRCGMGLFLYIDSPECVVLKYKSYFRDI